MSAPAVTIDGERLRIAFEQFDMDAYRLFLQTKALPETDVSYDWQADTYTLTAPARFASRLGVTGAPAQYIRLHPLAPHLRDYQRWAVDRALEAKRFALWADTGLGKTAMFLEWARQVASMTGGRVLILSPLAVIPQTAEESGRWYEGGLPVRFLRTRDELIDWCRDGDFTEIGICNYEKLIPGQITEFRYLAGLICDEASILRTGGGKIKWNLIHSAKGIEYKLACTATPAPNEAMEYASQAAFLEKLRSEGEILWTWFQKDKRGEWHIKPHAEAAFYTFMASWSLYMRDPAAWGFEDVLADLPDPQIIEERIGLTDEQRREMQAVQVKAGTGFFTDDRVGVTTRQKLMQIARGFVYETHGGRKIARLIDSEKARATAQRVVDLVRDGHRVLVWTTFDTEATVLTDHIGDLYRQLPGPTADIDVAQLSGEMSPEDRLPILQAFRNGDSDVLISKPQLIGYGLNLQFVTAMVFYGFDDSFERMYQAVRRAYRVGQTKQVLVYLPYVPELEGVVFGNVREKEARFIEQVAKQESAYHAAMAVQHA